MTNPERGAVLAALVDLLDRAPAFGEIGVVIHLHGGNVARIEERLIVSRKPGEGGRDGE